jgi:hypothetical protein
LVEVAGVVEVALVLAEVAEVEVAGVVERGVMQR